MVTLYTILISLLISLIPFFITLFSPLRHINYSTLYAIYHGILTFLTILAILGAIKKQSENRQIRIAWLYFFIGVILFIPSGITRYFLPEESNYVSKIMFLLAMIPIFIFAITISKPIRVMFLSRISLRLIIVLSISFVFILITLAIIPFILHRELFQKIDKELFIHFFDFIFHFVLLLPVIELLFIFGINKGNLPYMLISLGLLSGAFAYIPSIYFPIYNSIILNKLGIFFGTLEISLFLMAGLVEIGIWGRSIPKEHRH